MLEIFGSWAFAEAFSAEYNSEDLDMELAASDSSYIRFVLAALPHRETNVLIH